ncbi:hypothetical protein BKA65DRAFT_559678 [Rhexocercosporidium sp. MPI-PUGE-AT-0058]|nr:hypothetical protein BKA65DRAFT_559678 [Rhexocercosporidium sp. MPI-PUGE-AT-0058]
MNPSHVPAVRLSCEQCKRRKTKCDKQVPCTACKNAGIKCNTVQRARKPRGRTAQHKGGEIDTRVARLEDLVRQLKAQVQSGKGDEPRHQDPHSISSGSPVPKDSNALQKYVAPDFWEALSQEANGIREILEEFDSEDSPSDLATDSPMSSTEPSSSPGALLFNHGTPNTACDPAQLITHEMKGILFSIYKERVDCIVKVLHWPSVLAAIDKKDTGNLQSGLESARIHALEFAICYTAMCTVTDEEYETSLGWKREPLRGQLRLCAEISIAKANLLEQPDLTVLQAFIIYLLGLRCSTTTASAWTLLSIAVRLGSALGLGSEDPSKFSTFDLEIRRRVWLSIGVLDSQLALDRGAPALLSSQDLQEIPLNINDSDLDPQCSTPIGSVGFTDMSFASMTHQATLCVKALEDIPPDFDDSWNKWKETIAVFNAFEDYGSLHFSDVNASSPPLEQYAQTVAAGSLANIKLMLRRPPQRHRHSRTPPWDDYDVMKSTTFILERSLYKQANPVFNRWAWFNWVKWYALAVLLAELCGPVKGPETDHSYVVAQQTFIEYAQVVADSESGMLWRPIVKLMRRVQRLRGGSTVEGMSNLLSSPASTSQKATQGGVGKENGTFADLTINQSPALADSGNSFDPYFLEGTLGKPADDDVYGLMGLETSQPLGMDPIPGYGHSWANWDSFLEDMNNSASTDWGMDWQNVA